MSKNPKLVAAIVAAIAEELDEDISAIRILSFREMGESASYVSKRGYKKYQLEDERA